LPWLASYLSQSIRTGNVLPQRGQKSASTFNDGIPDSWRLKYFGSIYNLLSQASADADGDDDEEIGVSAMRF
jgi:hypothetical protein